MGNTLNLAKVGNTGKYDILELILLNIQSSFFEFNIKFKLIAYNCYPVHANVGQNTPRTKHPLLILA